jgi:hypothetical protein
MCLSGLTNPLAPTVPSHNPLLARACLLCFNWDDSEFFRGSTLLYFFFFFFFLYIS